MSLPKKEWSIEDHPKLKKWQTISRIVAPISFVALMYLLFFR